MRYLLLTVLFCFPALSHAQVKTANATWKVKTNGKIYGAAAYSNNRIYIGNISGTLSALDARNGNNIWEFETDGRWASKPLIKNNTLYQLNGNGTFYAIAIPDGQVKWAFKTGGEHRMERNAGNKTYKDIWDYYLSGTSYDKKTVYFGSSDGYIYALNATNGKLKWKFATSGEVHATPIISDSLIYAGSMDGKLYALNKADGSPVWTFDTIGARYFPKGAIQRAPVVVGHTLLFGSRDFNLYAINPKTGKGVWNYRDPGSWVVATPSVHKGKVFVGTSDSHLFYSFDLNSGQLNWKKHLNMRVYGSAVFDKQRVYFGCFNGFLYGLNQNNGTIEWQFQTDGSSRNYHTVFDDNDEFKDGFQIYGNSIRSMKTGEKQLQAMGSILSTPTKVNNMLYFGSTDSTFYAVELPD